MSPQTVITEEQADTSAATQMSTASALKIDPTYSIRRASNSDISEINELLQSYPDTILPRTPEEMAELIGMFWIAEVGNEIVGCCCLEVYSPKIAEIRSVAVKEPFQRIGIGESLVNEAVTEARSRNIRQILVITSSPEYFQRLSFGQCLNEKYALFWNGS